MFFCSSLLPIVVNVVRLDARYIALFRKEAVPTAPYAGVTALVSTATNVSLTP